MPRYICLSGNICKYLGRTSPNQYLQILYFNLFILHYISKQIFLISHFMANKDGYKIVKNNVKVYDIDQEYRKKRK